MPLNKETKHYGYKLTNIQTNLGGFFDVMDAIIGNGHDDTSSNPR